MKLVRDMKAPPSVYIKEEGFPETWDLTGHGGEGRAVGACSSSHIAFAVREQREMLTFLLRFYLRL